MKDRLYRLVKALGAPLNEIVGGWDVLDIHIDSIGIEDNIVFVYIWEDDIEWPFEANLLDDKYQLELIYQLEQILLN